MQLHFDVNDDAGRQEFLYQTVPALLSDITGEEKALWGQFAPQHMLEHLSWAVEASVGKIDHPLSVPDEKASLYREFCIMIYPRSVCSGIRYWIKYHPHFVLKAWMMPEKTC